MENVLQRPILVLNKNWNPVRVESVEDALAKLTGHDPKAQEKPKAYIVHPEDFNQLSWEQWTEIEPAADEICLRSVSKRVKIPEIITLAVFERQPGGKSTFNRNNLFKRDHYTCQYCGIRPESDEITVDHVVPRSRGGTSVWENCVLACYKCNSKKADKLPHEAGLVLRKLPVKPKVCPLAIDRIRYDSWRQFVSDAYWNVPLLPE